jgi:putative radical SAM enzyme (TIGR03279 family)
LDKRKKITTVTQGSIAESLEIEPGDFLLSIDGAEIQDVFDYRMAAASEELALLIEKGGASVAAGEEWELDIEKDEDEDLGLTFETPLMDEVRTCQNRCIFCFIDQQPQGLRDSLYVKDDDVRLSFLHGNYVTLTNISDAEVRRIARLRLSPLRISVHTTDLTLRCKMTGNKNANRLAAQLKRFVKANITMHFQAVICKGWNDGAVLDDTIGQLLAYRPQAKSLAIVPAGLTKHRESLAPLEAFLPHEATEIITQIEKWQKICRAKYNTAFVYAADEWYILANQPPTPANENDDFPQLENGVGLCALFEKEFTQNQPTRRSTQIKNIGIATGTAAAGFMGKLLYLFAKRHQNAKFRLFPIVNHFFGESVTVSGLLTGKDVIEQLQNKCSGLDVLFLPANAFRSGTEIMLDNTTRAQLEAALGVPVSIGSADGHEFVSQLIDVLHN